MVRKRYWSNGGQSDCRKAAKKSMEIYFFKVLIGDFRSKLYFPPAFARLIEDDDCDGATLNTLVGCYQDIEVLKDNYSMFFQNGWCEFVEHHSLQVGEFLVFRYDGGMQFQVKIFDRSGCERVCFKPIQVEDKISITCSSEKNASLSNVYLYDPSVTMNECDDEVLQTFYQRSRKKCNSSKNFFTESATRVGITELAKTSLTREVCDMNPGRNPVKSKSYSVNEAKGSSTPKEAIVIL